jgi:hypothetical protein
VAGCGVCAAWRSVNMSPASSDFWTPCMYFIHRRWEAELRAFGLWSHVVREMVLTFPRNLIHSSSFLLWRWRQKFPPKRWYPPNGENVPVYHNIIWILILWYTYYEILQLLLSTNVLSSLHPSGSVMFYSQQPNAFNCGFNVSTSNSINTIMNAVSKQLTEEAGRFLYNSINVYICSRLQPFGR